MREKISARLAHTIMMLRSDSKHLEVRRSLHKIIALRSVFMYAKSQTSISAALLLMAPLQRVIWHHFFRTFNPFTITQDWREVYFRCEFLPMNISACQGTRFILRLAVKNALKLFAMKISFFLHWLNLNFSETVGL